MTGSVFLLTKKNLQTTVLEKSLSEEFVVFTLSPTLAKSSISRLAGHIVLIDIGTLGKEEIKLTLKMVSSCDESITLALINAERSLDIQVVYDNPSIKGVFFFDDELDTLTRGVRRMLEGEYWLSRKVMSQLLEQHRSCSASQENNKTEANPLLEELTPRELEILKLVSTGASNSLIAEQVCLSTNTVKTHLTSLYRKLDINNRTQATIWVKNHLPHTFLENGVRGLQKVCFACLICLAIHTQAEEKLPDDGVVVDTELHGLVIDKTLTPPGRRFYREFARIWWDQDKTVPGNLVVRELPGALRGSQIAILYNRKPLYGTVLSPARSDIESKAKAAVRAADQKLQIIQLSRLFDNNPDLAKDEF